MKDFQKWYVRECDTKDCWCFCISTHPTSDSMEHCVVHSGVLTKTHAKRIVREHNEYPFLNAKIAVLKDTLAKERERMARFKKQRDLLQSEFAGLIASIEVASREAAVDGSPDKLCNRLNRITGRIREYIKRGWWVMKDIE